MLILLHHNKTFILNLKTNRKFILNLKTNRKFIIALCFRTYLEIDFRYIHNVRISLLSPFQSLSLLVQTTFGVLAFPIEIKICLNACWSITFITLSKVTRTNLVEEMKIMFKKTLFAFKQN